MNIIDALDKLKNRYKVRKKIGMMIFILQWIKIML